MLRLIVSFIMLAFCVAPAMAYTSVDLSTGAVSSTNIVNTPNYVLAGLGYKKSLLSFVTVSAVSVNVGIAYMSSLDNISFVTENAYTITQNSTVKHVFNSSLYGKYFKAMFLSKTGGSPIVRFLLRSPE